MKKILDLPEVLTVRDVQDYLSISKTTAYKLFREDSFPSLMVGGSRRITKKDFINWLEKQKG